LGHTEGLHKERPDREAHLRYGHTNPSVLEKRIRWTRIYLFPTSDVPEPAVYISRGVDPFNLPQGFPEDVG
jgi:hypothetical protein